MSDFDKEAEREKLREKYERDRADREATQRMSDLLLKGATMTNTHCNTCGDPLFRMNGTTFCPTCHGSPEAVEGTGLDERSDTDGSDAAADQSAETEEMGEASTETVDSPTESDRSPSEPESIDVRAPGDAADRAPSEATPADRPSSADRSAPSDRDADSTTPRGARAPDADRRSSDVRTSDADRRSGDDRSTDLASGANAAASTDGDLGNARRSLRAALERFAAEAAAADDPRYARECLQAAREAAEALDALR